MYSTDMSNAAVTMNCAMRTLIVLMLLVTSCTKKSQDLWYIANLQIYEDNLHNSALAIKKNEINTILVNSLKRYPRFVLLESQQKVPSGQSSLRCAFKIRQVKQNAKKNLTNPDPQIQTEVQVQMEIRIINSPDSWNSEGSGKTLTIATEQAVQGLVIQLETLGKTDSQLIEDLTSNDVRVRDAAVRMLAERKSSLALPALIKTLKDENRLVAMHAVGAIHAIGGKQAVAALTEMPESKDPQFLLALVELVASLGGGDAKAFLFTLASGHPQDAVREAARDALKRLDNLGSSRPAHHPAP